MQQKMIVLSLDALVAEDVEYLRTKPNFAKLMAHASGVEKTCTCYPSITYPAHITIITGTRPAKHGIYLNTEFKTVEDGYPHWFLESSCIKVEDLFAAAKRAGMTTGSVFWPIMGHNPNVDYLINEYFFYREKLEDAEAVFGAQGANEDALSIVRKNMPRLPWERDNKNALVAGGKATWRKFLDGTMWDNFIMGCVCDMIRDYQPDLLMAHNCIMDSVRHRYGIFNEKVTAALDRVDEWMGELIAALEASGTYENTNVVILSDHGQMNFVRRIKINTLLRRAGYIDVDENNLVTDWRVFGESNGMSATIFLKDPNDKKLWQEVYDFLQEKAADGVWGFSKVRTAKECLEEYQQYGDFAFMVETDGYTTFSDSWAEPIVANADMSDYRLGTATHGYEPEKGPQPVFWCRGPAFKQDVVIPRSLTIDEAPTLAAAFGQTMPQADGKVLREILK